MLDKNIKGCCNQFKIGEENAPIIKEVIMDTIKQFQNKTFRI